MKKLKIFLIMSVIILAVVYHVYTIMNLKNEIRDLKNKQEAIIQTGKMTGGLWEDYYRKLSARMIGILNHMQLVELAKDDWDYSLEINGSDFKGESINIDSQSLEIVLIEKRNEKSILPEDIVFQGKIPNYFYKQFKVESDLEPEVSNIDTEYVTSVSYKISALSPESKIKLSMSDELKTRLGLKYNNYTIYVK